jgi:hypothetical protein
MSWDWFNTAAGAASLGSLILGAMLGTVTWLQNRETKKILATMDATTKETMAQMDAGLKTVLDRMDARAEQRYRDLKDHLEGDADAR